MNGMKDSKPTALTYPMLTRAKVSHMRFSVRCCDHEFLNQKISAQAKGSPIGKFAPQENNPLYSSNCCLQLLVHNALHVIFVCYYSLLSLVGKRKIADKIKRIRRHVEGSSATHYRHGYCGIYCCFLECTDLAITTVHKT